MLAGKEQREIRVSRKRGKGRIARRVEDMPERGEGAGGLEGVKG